jgi:hypothetical protein
MSGILAVAALFITLFVGFKVWRYESREYYEKVDDETMRIWRDRVTNDRLEHPDEEYDYPVAEEAVHMLLKSDKKTRNRIVNQAIQNVRRRGLS